MARKPATRLVRLGVAVTSWVVAITVAEAVFGADLARAAEQVEERIELQLRGLAAPVGPQQPERSHDDESFEPWELVSV